MEIGRSLFFCFFAKAGSTGGEKYVKIMKLRYGMIDRKE